MPCDFQGEGTRSSSLTSKYATRDSILAQNSIAEHRRAVSCTGSSGARKPGRGRVKRPAAEQAGPAERSKSKKPRVSSTKTMIEDTKPVVIDLCDAGAGPQVISLLDSDDDL